MPAPRRRSPVPFARLLLLALLALGVALAPVLSFAAEAHDAVAHADDHRDGAAGHDHADAPQQQDAGQALHVAMHVAGCCGHLCATLPATLALAAPPPADVPDASIDAPAPDTRAENLLRPPIRA